jgi:hypothetical protein
LSKMQKILHLIRKVFTLEVSGGSIDPPDSHGRRPYFLKSGNVFKKFDHLLKRIIHTSVESNWLPKVDTSCSLKPSTGYKLVAQSIIDTSYGFKVHLTIEHPVHLCN